MKYIKGIRWWMVTLVTMALIINYLARNTLSVAAPTMMADLQMSTQQYSYVIVSWQVCYALMQPVAGYILDAVGMKIGFGAFALAWSLVCAAAALATSWQGMAFFRGVLGMAEAAGIPGGVKAVTEWFPAQERSVAIGWFNIGSSIGALCAPPLVVWTILHGSWKLSFIAVGVFGLAWFVLWVLFYKSPREQTRLSPSERAYILDNQAQPLERPKKESWLKIVRSMNFWSIAIPRFLSEPAWQTFNAWIPLYMATERHMNIKEIAMFAWLPFLAADIGCVLGGYLSPWFHKHLKVSLFTSRKLVMLVGSLAMIGPACVGFVDSPYVAIGLLSIGGFAHQTLSGALYSITSDVFSKNQIATATGLTGMSGYLGATIFTLVFGVLVTQIGYGPLFIVLAVFDLIAVAVVFAIARQRNEAYA